MAAWHVYALRAFCNAPSLHASCEGRRLRSGELVEPAVQTTEEAEFSSTMLLQCR